MRYHVCIRHKSGGQDYWKLVPATSPDEAARYARKRWGGRFLSVGEVCDGVNASLRDDA